MKLTRKCLDGLAVGLALGSACLSAVATPMPDPPQPPPPPPPPTVMIGPITELSSAGGGPYTLIPVDDMGLGLINPYHAKAKVNFADIGWSDTDLYGFQSFCIEFNENFDNWYTYNVQISGSARNGGAGVGPNDTLGVSDVVSAGTGYIYSKFALGQLSSSEYDYTMAAPGERSAAGGALQLLIWYLEDEKDISELTGVGGLMGSYLAALMVDVEARFGGSLANAKLDSYFDDDLDILLDAAGYGVFALNMSPDGLAFGEVQDQLIYRGGGFQQLPDGGATFMLLAMGIGAMGVYHQRSRKKN